MNDLPHPVHRVLVIVCYRVDWNEWIDMNTILEYMDCYAMCFYMYKSNETPYRLIRSTRPT